MAQPFHELRERLLAAGVAPRHVRRYLIELRDHLADLKSEEERAGRNAADAESAAIVRLGGMDDLAAAMIGQRHFQSWCARAPWAMFALMPLFVLGIAYLIAGFIVWSLWMIFMPVVDTPFGHRVYGLAVLWVAAGKLDYFGAPIFIGWGIGVFAARQRIKMIWPFVGLTLIAMIAGTAKFHAFRSAVPGEVVHIGIDLTLGPTIHGISYGLLHGLSVLIVTALPYLVWRSRRTHFLSP